MSAPAPTPAPDQLRELFRMQQALNQRIGVFTDRMDEAEKTKWILNYSRAMSQELAELTDSVPWKWWAKYQQFDEQNARVEVVDLLHFLISMAQVLGLGADDVFQAYVKKNEVNLKRQDSGYVAKDHADSRHIQGRAMIRPSVPRAVPGRARVPAAHDSDVAAVLIPAARIRRRVRELAGQITRDYAGQDPVIVALLNGTVAFLADLIRHLEFPLHLDFLGVSSYGCGTESGTLVYTKELRLALRDRPVLIVDDILDTGRTLRAVIARLQALQPASLRTCVLLDKPERRVAGFAADYTGFVIPNVFVVGYGLDYDERYRNLPFVGVLKPHVYAVPKVRSPS